MVDVFAEWLENAPVDRCGIPEHGFDGCPHLLKVRWRESFVAAGGRRLICRFSAPDAESVRIALRRTGIAVEAVWSGTVHRWIAGNRDGSLDDVFLPALPAGIDHALARSIAAGIAPGEPELTRAIVSSDRSRLIGVCDTTGGSASFMLAPIDDASRRGVWRCRRFAARPGSAITQAGLTVLIWPAA